MQLCLHRHQRMAQQVAAIGRQAHSCSQLLGVLPAHSTCSVRVMLCTLLWDNMHWHVLPQLPHLC